MNTELQIQSFRDTYAALQAEIGKVIVGHTAIVENTLIALFGGGHVLLEGVPGLGKTLLIRTLGEVLDMPFNRIQFTPDLMPADILGTNLVMETDAGKRAFEFQRGPIFAHLILADEINRATPKTQSAMLEAMQEKQVTAGGELRKLGEPFFVMATQNPIDQEGTYPLPEAQLDRFLLQVDVGYPDLDSERTMLLATTGAAEAAPVATLTAGELMAAQALIRRVPVGESVVDAILALVRGGRPETAADAGIGKHVAWGPGPRAAQALMLASRARALLQGRLAPSIDDVAALAGPVLRHRMALNFAARAEGVVLDELIGRLVERLG